MTAMTTTELIQRRRRRRRRRYLLPGGGVAMTTMTSLLMLIIGFYVSSFISLVEYTDNIGLVDAFHIHQHRCHHYYSPVVSSSSSSSSSFSSSALLMSLDGTTVTTTIINIPDRNKLQSMKVIELKQLIKDLGLNERGGVLSKLKRKKELIDYLDEYENENENETTSTSDPEESSSSLSSSSSSSSSLSPSSSSSNDDNIDIDIDIDNDNDNDDINDFLSQLFVPPKGETELLDDVPKQQQQPKKKTPMRMPSTTTSSSSSSSSSGRSKKHAYNDEYIDNTNIIDNGNNNNTPLQANEELLREVKVIPKTNNQINKNNNQHPNSFLSQLYDQVNNVYPTLQYLQDGNKTFMGELDVRQRYHPMLLKPNTAEDDEDDGNNSQENDDDDIKNNPSLSGDMDIIFIGTASCTPSMTRGVSCTALRLHSLPGSGSHSDYKHIKQSQKQQGGNSSNGSNQQQSTNSNQKEHSKQKSTNLGTWLFDCGEGTQLQIQRTSSIRPSKITKIFITHAHGDHSFGLPGLLCLMGQDTAGGNESEKTSSGDNIKKSKDTKEPIDIYGPEGLRMWLRIAIRYSVSRIVPRYRVHELKDVTMAPEWGYSEKWEKYFYNKTAFYDSRNNGGERGGHQHYWDWGTANNRRIDASTKDTSDWVTQCELNSSPSGVNGASGTGGVIGLEPSQIYGEVPGGRDIYPNYDHPLCNDGAPIWEVETSSDDDNDDDKDGSSGVRVYAAPMSHGVPCVGYVIEEPNRPGRLRDEYVKPICVRNIKALKEAGFKHPMKALAVIKDLPEGGSFTFPDGTIVTQQDAVEPSRPGRKVVICGDTNSARSLEKLARDADVVVHEATNTFLHALDHKDSNLKSVTREAIFHGHSTPTMAGEFCKRINAKRLILNHFSARYMGDKSIESISIMTRIEQQAIKASGLTRSDVAAAWDFMIFPIPKAKNDDQSNNGSDDDSK